MKKTARDEAAKLFEEFVMKAPVVNKDAGNKKSGSFNRDGRTREDPNTVTVDLHGFNLEEAVREADQALRQLGRNGVGKVRIITGIGRHSPGLYSPLYEGLEDHLNGKAGLSFIKKDGVFTVCIK